MGGGLGRGIEVLGVVEVKEEGGGLGLGIEREGERGLLVHYGDGGIVTFDSKHMPVNV